MKNEKNNVENTNNDSVNAILAEDKNNIDEATDKAIQNVDSVAYSGNLVKPKKNKTKSISDLNIKDNNDIKQNEDTTNNTQTDSENDKKDDTTEENILKTNNDENEKKYTISSKPKESHKTLIIISCIIAFIIFLFLLLSTIFALVAQNNPKIINGTEIKNIDVSGLTREEAYEKLNTIFQENLSKTITLKHNDYKTEISPNQLEVNFNLQDAINIAYEKGHSGNIFKDNYEIIISSLAHNKINPGFSYNEESLNSLINEIENNLEDHLIQSSYYIDENDLVLSKGKSGIVINSKELKTDIIYMITNLNLDAAEINIPTEYKNPDSLDLNKIHNEVVREPKNAYYTTDPYVIYPHVDGIDFDISLDEAISNLNNSTEETVIIPLRLITPEITTSQIGTEAFPDELGAYSTKYSTSNVNRSTNIRLASEKINGTVVMPGEVFSYNTTVGQRTAAAGFKTAAVYSGGEVTTGIGGGICQVSSTLYNAVLLSNLEIVERYNHGFNPGYVAVSRDATVSWGGPDFKFKNTRDYPIKIVCSGTGGTITVQIFGLRGEDEYTVEIESYVTKWISYSTSTKEDPTLPTGQTKIIQNGSNGCRSVAYRILKKDGEEVSRELLSQDTYSPHNKIVAVGT